MRLWQDGLTAMLAAVGLATILWMIVSLFLRKNRPRTIQWMAAKPTAASMALSPSCQSRMCIHLSPSYAPAGQRVRGPYREMTP